MITIMDALLSIRPGSQWIVNNDVLTWLDTEQTEPTQQEIDDEIARLQQEYDNKEYQRQRVVEYPSIGDQLDALFKAGVFPADMAAQIQAVKDKYPKA